MRPLPNLEDAAAMAARGRRSVLMSARNDACQELRDVAVALQSCDVFTEDVGPLCKRGRDALARLTQVHSLASGEA